MAERFCTHCGSLIPEGANFCPQCGAPVGENRPTNNVTPSSSGMVSASKQQGSGKTSFSLSVVSLVVGAAALILGVVCIFLPINVQLASLLKRAVDLSVISLVLSIIGVCLNKKDSYKGPLSKKLNIVGIVVGAIDLILAISLYSYVNWVL